ncbi:hypothetical protein DL769_000885 [Monosporascus sp. CRB-8-3]|nr:hypothetical protein DL769_000885 [Monosporascus sp. CRB-8-3]
MRSATSTTSSRRSAVFAAVPVELVLLLLLTRDILRPMESGSNYGMGFGFMGGTPGPGPFASAAGFRCLWWLRSAFRRSSSSGQTPRIEPLQNRPLQTMRRSSFPENDYFDADLKRFAILRAID